MTIFKSGMSMMLSKYSFMVQLYISDGSIFNFILRLNVSVVCRNCHSLDFPFQCFLLYFVEFISPPVLLCTPVCHLFICVFKSFPPSDGSSVFPVLLVCLCLLLVCQLLFLHTFWFVKSFVFLIFSWILFRLPFCCLTFFLFLDIRLHFLKLAFCFHQSVLVVSAFGSFFAKQEHTLPAFHLAVGLKLLNSKIQWNNQGTFPARFRVIMYHH